MIFDELVSPSAFAGEVALSGGWEGFVEVICHGGVAGELAHGGVIGDVEGAWMFAGGEEEAGAGSVGNVDLIEDAAPVFFDDGGPVHELTKNDAAIGTVESAEAGSGVDLGFSLEEDLTGLAIGVGRAGFVDFFAVGLVVNRGAGGEDEVGVGEGLFEEAGSVEKDTEVGLWTAAAGAGGEDDEVGRGDPSGEVSDRGGVGKVAGEGAVAPAFGESGDEEVGRGEAGDFGAEKSGSSDEEMIHDL